jgi:hypothetical protein
VTPTPKDSIVPTVPTAFSSLLAEGLFWRYAIKTGSPDETKKKQPTIGGHIGIAAAMLVAFLIAHFGLGAYITHLQNSWLETAQASKTQKSKQEELRIAQGMIQRANIAAISPIKKDRLLQQFANIQNLEARYLEMTCYFGREYFVATVMKYICGLIAAVCAFFISRDGWEKSNNSLINIFFVSSIALTYYTDSVGIFKHQANLQTSLDLYLRCISTKNMVLSYYAHKQDTQPIPVDQFIDNLDAKIDELGQFKWGLDGNLDPSFNSQINRLLKPSEGKGSASSKS